MAEATPAIAASGGAGAWTGHAFGIELQATFHAVAILETPAGSSGHAPSARHAHLELVGDTALDAAWPAKGAATLRDLRDDAGRSVLMIDEHPDDGYRLDASYYGRFVVSRDGRHVQCAPEPIADWEWHAFLVGQILPLLAVLQGLEVMHGSAVAYGDDAIGLVAPSGGGKSSLAVNLIRQGAAFAADDVLALERDGAGVVLQPGPPLASVRHAEAAAIGRSGVAEVGTVVGHSDEELRVAVSLDPHPLNLAALYFIERAEQEPSHAIEAIEPGPQLLLNGSYNGFVRTRARMAAQLDLYAHLAQTVSTFRAVVWPGIDAYGLASLIQDHARHAIASTA